VSKRIASGIAVATAAVVLIGLVVVVRSGAASRDKTQGGAVAEPAAVPNLPPRLAPPVPPRAPTPNPIPVRPPPPAPPAAIDARPVVAAPPAPLSEAKLMEKLRQARKAGEHVLAIQLAREGNRRFPGSALAPERESILIHSLADNEQRSEARGEAERMVNRYADSDWVREIERFTGAHRHRNVRLNDAGEIEYY
jgi:hypothetical protein